MGACLHRDGGRVTIQIRQGLSKHLFLKGEVQRTLREGITTSEFDPNRTCAAVTPPYNSEVKELFKKMRDETR